MKQDQATIIRLTKLTDTSLIVSWMTDHHGLVKTVAKGARRPKSSFAGRLDLFFTSDISWTESVKSELGTLKEVSPTHYREELRLSYIKTEVAAYFTSLMESTVEPNLPADGYHDLLQRALNFLCEKQASLNALYFFESELTKLLGIYSNREQASSNIAQAFGSLPPNRGRCIELLDNSD